MMGMSCSDFNGERLAISEFNEEHQMRKLSPIHGLRFLLRKKYSDKSWLEKSYMAHILDNNAYVQYDGLQKRKELPI